jgi:hypothetical protein
MPKALFTPKLVKLKPVVKPEQHDQAVSETKPKKS